MHRPDSSTTKRITPNTGFKRFTGRLSADTQAKSWLKLGGSMSYTHYSASRMSEDGTSNSSGNIFAAATEVAPIHPSSSATDRKDIIIDQNGIKRYDYGDGENAGLQRPVFGQSNAISSTILDTNKYNGNALSGSGFVEIRFLKDFKFTSNNSVDYNETRYSSITNPYYGGYASSNGIVTKTSTHRLSTTFQQLLNWNHMFNGVHEVTALVGHEFYQDKYNYLSANRSNMFDPSNDELDGAILSGESGSYRTYYNNEAGSSADSTTTLRNTSDRFRSVATLHRASTPTTAGATSGVPAEHGSYPRKASSTFRGSTC